MNLICFSNYCFNFVLKFCCKEISENYIYLRLFLLFIYNLNCKLLLDLFHCSLIRFGGSALIGQEVPECAPDEHIQHMYHPQNHSIL